jgi:hypothetical protein
MSHIARSETQCKVRAGLAVITGRRLRRTSLRPEATARQAKRGSCAETVRRSPGSKTKPEIFFRCSKRTDPGSIPTGKPVGYASPAHVFFGGCRRRRPFPCATDQMQTRNSTPGQTKRMTNVITKVMAIAILAINGKGGVVDCVGPSRRRDARTFTRRSSRVIAKTAASHTQNKPTL